MPDILKNLTPQALFIILIVTVVLGLIAVVIIALRGKLGIKIGNKSINLGGGGGDEKSSKKKDTKTSPVPAVPPATVTISQKRTCGDCVLLLMGEREKYELKMRSEIDKVMKTQMTFAEQKLIEMQTAYGGIICNLIRHAIEEKVSTVEESIQYKLVYGLLKDSLIHIKDEIRRSFKENGFSNISGSEFTWYVKERYAAISSMFTQYIRDIYPDRGGVLQLYKILKAIEEHNTLLTGIVNDIYNFARETRIDSDKRVKSLKTQFGAWVDNFIK